MIWPFLTLLVFLVLVLVEISWRRKFARAQQAAQAENARLRQATEQLAQQTQTQQEALFNSMAEGLLVLDQNGRIQLANRAFGGLFGAMADVRGKTIIEAVRLHELADLVEFLGTQKRVLGYELKLSQPAERWVEVNGAAVFNGGGQRHGTILIFHDLTRVKQLESARKDFVANVSHELRTPLSLIKGYVETLLDGAKDNPEVSAKFLHTIERNADRLKLLIEDLLTISELESGRMELKVQPLALHPLVDTVLEDLKARAAARDVTLCNDAADLLVQGDSDRLEQ